MNNAKVANAPGSGTTSSAARKHHRPSRELEYLNRQAADATAALANTAQEMGRQLRQTARAHPLLALGTVAVGGALLGRVLAGRPHSPDRVSAKRRSPDDPNSFIHGLVNDAIKPLIPTVIAAALAMFQPRESASPQPPSR